MCFAKVTIIPCKRQSLAKQRANQCDQTWPFPANLAVFGVRVAGKIWRIHYIVAGFRSMCGHFSTCPYLVNGRFSDRGWPVH